MYWPFLFFYINNHGLYLNFYIRNIDLRCGKVDYIQTGGREIQTDYVFSNNFAFGGVNTSLVFKRWQE